MKVRFVNSSDRVLIGHDSGREDESGVNYVSVAAHAVEGDCYFNIIYTPECVAWLGSFLVEDQFRLEIDCPEGDFLFVYHWNEPDAEQGNNPIGISVMIENGGSMRKVNGLSGKGRMLLFQFLSRSTFSNNSATISFPADSPITIVLQQLLAYPLINRNLKDYIRYKAMELWILMGDMIEEWVKSNGIPEDIRIKIELIDRLLRGDPSANRSIAMLAKQAGINQTHLQRYFRKWSGMTIHQYSMRIRMEMAFRQLQEKKKTIKEIAFELGFKNDANFSEAFKNFFGYRPGEFRKAKGNYEKDKSVDHKKYNGKHNAGGED